MIYINELLAELTARLPELEWKISELSTSFSNKSLPIGLFRSNIEPSAAACVAEIKADIKALSQQKNERSAFYLAERIKQKVSVLVVLCQRQNRQKKTEDKVYFGVKMLSTRQQWLQDLEAEINTLSRQQQAMTKTLEQKRRNHHLEAVLHLKAELGEVEKRLTLAQEALYRA